MALIKLQNDADLALGQYYEFDPENRSMVLGKGGMGVVFKGKLIQSETAKFEYVAIKVLFKDLAEESVMRAKREASIQILHENVIRMYGFIETLDYDSKPKYHVISEYLDGETLSDSLKKSKSFPWKESLQITKKILAALFMLHEKGFVHRDIDPSNVMICKDGKVKLIDFGIAKQTNEYHNEFQQGTLEGKFIGKVNYASPEQAKGNHWLTNATSDIYSVGILLFELLTGKLPYNGTTYEIIKGHLDQPIPFNELPFISENKIVSDGLKYMIGKATNKIQNKRYQTASEFITDIEKVLKGNTIIPKPISKWIYLVSAIIVITFAFKIYLGSNEAKYNKVINQANSNLSVAKYENALAGFKEAYSIRQSDSVSSKIKMLEVLTPAVANYINSDYKKADSLFQIAVLMNSSDANYYLGEMCSEGIGTPKDFKKGFKYTSKAVDLGNKLAEYRLGLIYQNGIDTKVDKDKASRYFERAGHIIDRGVEADNPEFQFVKGNMFLQGNGVARNEKLALEFYEKAANHNYPQAQYELYIIFSKADNDKAIKWLTKSAERGYPKAQLKLGESLIAQKKYKEGFDWTKKAAEKNYAPALRKLGAIYQERVTSQELIAIQKATEINGNDSISYKYLCSSVDFDHDYMEGRYALAIKSYGFAISLLNKDLKKAKQYFVIALKNIDALPFTEVDRKRIYDKSFPSAEQIRAAILAQN